MVNYDPSYGMSQQNSMLYQYPQYNNNMYCNYYPQQQYQTNYTQTQSIQDMISNGGFGYMSPNQYNNFGYYNNMPSNQYANILPIGGGYSSNNYQPEYYKQQQYDYYNPYGAPIQNGYNQYLPNNMYQNQLMYNNQYYYNPQQAQRYSYAIDGVEYIIPTKYDFDLMRYRFFMGKDASEEEFKKKYYPEKLPPRQYTDKELRRIDLARKACIYEYAPKVESTRDSYILRASMAAFDNAYKDYDLPQFLAKALPEIKELIWIRENTHDISRDFSRMYDRNYYQHLLRFHRDYSDEIIDLAKKTQRGNLTSDDIEMGFKLANALEERKEAIRRGIFTNPLSDLADNQKYREGKRKFVEECRAMCEKSKQDKINKKLGLEE